ncbi:MAG: hypothetical protein R3B70_35185 [Polyangiaceae bacterium]
MEDEEERDDSDIDDPGGPPPGVLFRAAMLPEYIRGFPLHAAITLRPDPPGATLRLLPWPTLASTANAIGYLLTEPGSPHTVAERIPRPVIAMDPDDPGLTLPSHGAYRTLIDLAPLWPPHLPAGQYRLTLLFISGFGRAETAPFEIAYRDPTLEEQRTLDDRRPEIPRGGTWFVWSRAPAADKPTLRGPFAANDPLAYLALQRWFLRGDDDLADIAPSTLDVLPPLYAPEADLLRAELARARGDLPTFDALEQRLLADHPGFRAHLDDIRDGHSELQEINEARRARKR